MQAYSYNSETMEYAGPADCQLDPIRSQREGREVYLLPGDSTWTAPPAFDPETQKAKWTGEAWEVEEIPPEPEPGPSPEPEPTYTSDDLFAALLGG